MNRPEMIFLGLVAAILLIGFAWTFAPGNNRFSATGPAETKADDNRPGGEPHASNP